MAKKIHLSFLWHQHQPFYTDLKTGRSAMPWVRLHATKDYYDMAAVLERFPKIRATFNLVPSLVLQLLDFSEGKTTDPWLEKTLTPASQLTEDDQRWILENFFHCNWDTMVLPRNRYRDLLDKRGRNPGPETAAQAHRLFSPQDFLDLQVWFNLSWMDPLWQKGDPFIAGLFEKGSGFTEEEKHKLIEKQREIARLTIEKHRELWHKGQIEVSTTPFYHPILPLLCDTDSAQMAMPGSLKPRQRFAHPEDAKRQMTDALDFMEKIFGKRPVGIWPSEGSVSEAAVKILSEAGVLWAATDEQVLFRSLSLDGKKSERSDLYHSYRIEPAGENFQMVFRDQPLSDAIGFAYARVNAEQAASNFISHVERIADSIPESEGPAILPVILDGENCWESYKNDGHDFLDALYQKLSDHPSIETITIGDFVQKYPASRTVKKLWAGSWIGADFGIWIGHPEDNRAWDCLSEARDFLESRLKAEPQISDQPDTKLAWQSLLVAEGSDWCWWYGDQHSTAQDSVFDDLYRTHLKNVYRFMGEEPPTKLNLPIKAPAKKTILSTPVELFTPKIDGLATSYYEWRAAGHFIVEQNFSTMHQAVTFLSALYYGFDLNNLYLRLDPKFGLDQVPLQDTQIRIHFIHPQDYEIELSWNETGLQAGILKPEGIREPLKQAAAKKVIELAIPFKALDRGVGDPVELIVLILKRGVGFEQWPLNQSIHFNRPNKDFGADFWLT